MDGLSEMLYAEVFAEIDYTSFKMKSTSWKPQNQGRNAAVWVALFEGVSGFIL